MSNKKNKRPAESVVQQPSVSVWPQDKKRAVLLAAILSLGIILTGFICYSSSFQNAFLWDDRDLITEDPVVRTGDNLSHFFTKNLAYDAGAKNNFYRPLYCLLNRFDYKRGGGKPFAFHITNTFLHTACSVLVAIFLLLITRNFYIAFGAAFLYVVHPVHTQAVTYIAGRGDPMYAFWGLLTIILFLYYKKSGKKLYYLAALLSYPLAILSKEAATFIPFLMLLCIFAFRTEEGEKKSLSGDAKSLLPFFVIVGIYALLRFSVLNFSSTMTSAISDIPATPLPVRVLTAFKAIFLYIRFLLIPVGFQMETYLPKSHSVLEPAVISSIFGLVVLFFLVRSCYRRDRVLFFGFAWFLVGLLPILNFFPINAEFAVHWLYLPSIGFILVLCASFWKWLNSSGYRILFKGHEVKVYVGLLLAVCLGFGSLTYAKNFEWKDEETLYLNILPLSQSPRIYINLANIYLKKDKKDEAIALYERALQIYPNQTEAYCNLGYVYNIKGDYAKAEMVLKRAVELSPLHVASHLNLAAVYSNQGRLNLALQEVQYLEKLNPNNIEVLNIMGQIYTRLGNRAEAKRYYERSVSIDPNQPGAQQALRALL